MIGSIVSILAGMLILMFPKMLRIIVGGYLIIAGILGFIGWFF